MNNVMKESFNIVMSRPSFVLLDSISMDYYFT